MWRWLSFQYVIVLLLLLYFVSMLLVLIARVIATWLGVALSVREVLGNITVPDTGHPERSGRGSSEKVGRWPRTEGVWRVAPPQLWRSGSVTPGKFFKMWSQICAIWCIFATSATENVQFVHVHVLPHDPALILFWDFGAIQITCLLTYLLTYFNLDFGRSIWWRQVIKSVTENRRFSVPREFTVPAV